MYLAIGIKNILIKGDQAKIDQILTLVGSARPLFFLQHCARLVSLN